MRLRCRLGFHDLAPDDLPESLRRKLLALRWSWSVRGCVYCDYVVIRTFMVRRIDGETGSVRG